MRTKGDPVRAQNLPQQNFPARASRKNPGGETRVQMFDNRSNYSQYTTTFGLKSLSVSRDTSIYESSTIDSPKSNRLLAVCAIVGLSVTLTGTALAANDFEEGVVIRFVGMSLLLLAGVIFVGCPFFARHIKRLNEKRERNMNTRRSTETPAKFIYVQILVTASRVFGCLLLAIAAIQFSLAMLELATSGFPNGRFASSRIVSWLFQALLIPILAAGTGLVVLCIAEILNRLTMLHGNR